MHVNLRPGMLGLMLVINDGIKTGFLGLMLVLFKPCNGDLSSTCLIAAFMRIYTIYAS